LLFDTPRGFTLGWYNLIVINSLEDDFNDRYSVRDERNVVKFLLGDETNPSSVISSLKALRENVRTTRDVVPEETWEWINELNMYIQANLQLGINRSKRHEFLEEIIKGCQQVLGLLYGSMPHDAAWIFLRLGRNLERADMTTRNLDAGMAAIIEREEDESIVNIRQIIWGNVLRALNADQAYRRTMRCAVQSEAVIEFLLENEEFPRSIAHCLNALIDSCAKLPRSKLIVAELHAIRKEILVEINYDHLGIPFREYLNRLQIHLSNIAQLISNTWFPAVV
jgi:uncharacterized alpha-E superfamily protein